MMNQQPVYSLSSLSWQLWGCNCHCAWHHGKAPAGHTVLGALGLSIPCSTLRVVTAANNSSEQQNIHHRLFRDPEKPNSKLKATAGGKTGRTVGAALSDPPGVVPIVTALGVMVCAASWTSALMHDVTERWTVLADCWSAL